MGNQAEMDLAKSLENNQSVIRLSGKKREREKKEHKLELRMK